MKKTLILIMTAALFLFSTSAFAENYKGTMIMAATANPSGSLHAVALEKFKEIVEKESGGKVRVNLFLGGSMGSEQANVKQLRDAELHVAVLAAGNLTPFAPAATITILPYLFPQIENAYSLFRNDGFVSDLGDTVATQSMTRPLGWLIGGYRVLTNSKHDITKIDDLQGLKIRVPKVRIQLDSFRSWGVEPHPLAWSETFNALQQGVADGQENPHSINQDQKFWEVQKYITDLHYMLWVGPLLVSEKWFQRLPANTQALVKKAAKEACEHEWEWVAQQNKTALDNCLKHGMVLKELSDEDVWMNKARSLWPEYYETVGGKDKIDNALKIMGQD
ncbi:TRAP transporter substrate-binding protein [Pseudodesulfovibrio thermohalotolerans]|uniref:TRAP transporter substrate-binding protein n=1 Tax=Pseudodesulfovibrio thermohalotolerans TaxID=2880651 RepID=UPI002441FAB6|nr:TRAP transporter substrate-binding protein [Pseudodesulfovibrio thermohalotolerans]WFS62802.1 TRAP transporter substrate-binding protein [Pseudodesulfovibrio thermohalotolerans]